MIAKNMFYSESPKIKEYRDMKLEDIIKDIKRKETRNEKDNV